MTEIKSPSPSNRYHFEIIPWEARMSLWIESFRLIEAGGALVFEPRDSNWSLDGAEWVSDDRVKLALRRYPGDHTPSQFEIEIDCTARTAHLPDSQSTNLAELSDGLDALYERRRTAHQKAPQPNRLKRLLGLFKSG